ncbi:unnamed protein product [Paramecium pentaurelia]|uniref:Uncharacterized protein n=1 Tax=Paramecium pentaurelia TaxID=43138 RepID=A0A8S1V5S7_9CILI|nr:unnamed protein product [Paramecium pentaurelia]
MDDQYSELAFDCVENSLKILDNFKNQTLLSQKLNQLNQKIWCFNSLFNELYKMSIKTIVSLIKNFRLQIPRCYGYKKRQDISIINYLKLGWNLENWRGLAKYTVQEREYFYIYLNIYEEMQSCIDIDFQIIISRLQLNNIY